MRIGGIDGFPLVVDLQGKDYRAFRIAIEGVGFLNFDEFEIWTHRDGAWENLALNKPASQTSQSKDWFGPETGNSGVISGETGPHTEREPNPHWQIDLGDFHRCDYLALFNRVRFAAWGLHGVRLYGHNQQNRWELLFSDAAEPHTLLWGNQMLDLIEHRITAQLHAAITPQSSMDSDQARKRARSSAAFYVQLERLEALRDLLPASRAAHGMAGKPQGAKNPALAPLQAAIRGSLRAALPLRLAVPPTGQVLLDVTECSTIEIRHRPAGSEAGTPGVNADTFELEFFTYEPPSHAARTRRKGSPTPQELFDVRSCRLATTTSFDVEDTGVVITWDESRIVSPGWEVWGRHNDGTSTLLYDNTAVSRGIFQMLFLLERGKRTFDDVALGARSLEVEGEYEAAWLHSLYTPTEEPTANEVGDYLDQIEYRSFVGTGPALTRTKHGYASTFRFRNKPAFASGVQIVAESLQAAGYVGVPFYGTLLGALREGSLIDHDDDADLLMLNDATSEADVEQYRNELLGWLRTNTDWTIYPGDRMPGKNISVAFDHDGEWVHCDLFPTWIEGDQRMILHEGKGGFHPLPATLFDADRAITIEGAHFRIPEQSEQLLELVYGDWRTPYRSYMLDFHYQRWTDRMVSPASTEDSAAPDTTTTPNHQVNERTQAT